MSTPGLERHRVTRQIGIDAGHRIPRHESKCRNLHGHRYEIFATVEGPLQKLGSNEGMVIDFGFMKEAMMQEIDRICDHSMILHVDDPYLNHICYDVEPERLEVFKQQARERYGICPSIDERTGAPAMKVVLVPFVPTAENLARWWFDKLTANSSFRMRASLGIRLVSVRVFETPNCSAEYMPALPSPTPPSGIA
jgi:6-pyruvoyltetrahydropterin/6-carboxytetrahydropterin synthase